MRSGQSSRIAFDRPAFEPGSKRRNLLVGQTPLVDKLAVARFRLPRRHHAVARRGNNLRGVALDVVVGE
jgi:hypothetical protein